MFVVAATGSIEWLVMRAEAVFSEKGMVVKRDIEKELESRGISFHKNGISGSQDVGAEEEEMARLMDEKIVAN